MIACMRHLKAVVLLVAASALLAMGCDKNIREVRSGDAQHNPTRLVADASR